MPMASKKQQKPICHVRVCHRDGETGAAKEEIEEKANVLFIAGSETSATTLSGLIFYLSRFPDTQRNLIKEIKSSYSSAKDITQRNTAELQYLHACVEELLVYPPVATTAERVSPGAELNGIYIPKGVSFF